MAQSIVAYVDNALDDAEIGRIHRRVFAIVTAGLFFDVIDFIILGSLVPDMVRSHFASPAEIGTVGTAQIIGLFTGAIGQGEFTDRLGRKRIYQLSVLLYSVATIAAALAPNPLWLAFGRLIAGIGLGAAAPTCFSYVAEYSPKRIRGRATAFMQFIGGACVWPLGTLLALGLRDTIGWRGDLGRHRPRRAGRICTELRIAGIAALAGHARPRKASARSARTNGPQEAGSRATSSSWTRSPISTAIRWVWCFADIASASSPR